MVRKFANGIVYLNFQAFAVCIADIVFHFFPFDKRIVDPRVDWRSMVNIYHTCTCRFNGI
ncbi:hypothetical protein D3C73_695610 [compost metagenome]